MNLDQAKVVIAGGTGGVGEGLVRAFLRQGAQVLVPSRSEAKLAELHEQVSDIPTGKLTTIVGSFGEPDKAAALAEGIRGELGELDVAVASLGGWKQGPPIYEVPFEMWQRVLEDNLTSHFLAMRVLLPLLADRQGAYVHINGLAAEMTYRGAGPVTAMAAAQRSLVLTLAEEVKLLGISVQEMILPPIGTRKSRDRGRLQRIGAEEVGDYIVQMIQRNDRTVVHRIAGRRE